MKPTRFEMAVLAIVVTIVFYRAFMPPIVGLADSGDFERLMPQAGLSHVSPDYDKRYFRYFNSKYRIVARTAFPDSYMSSTLLAIRAARWLSIHAGEEEFFDIRVLAGLRLLVLIFGLWLVLVSVRSLRFPIRLLIGMLMVLIFTSAGYVAYLNSFYSEPTALCFITVAIGCALLIINGRSKSRGWLIGFFAASAFVVTAKPQYVPLAFIFGAFGIYLATQAKVRKLGPVVALVLCSIAGWYYLQTPRELRVQIAYIGIFDDLLPNSATPVEDLNSLGLSPEMISLAGTIPYQPDTPMNDPEIRDAIYSRVSSHTLPMFYLKRPARLLDLFERAAHHAFTNRISRLGYYESDAGMPAQSGPPQLWGAIREKLIARNLLFILAFFATGAVAALFAVKSGSTNVKRISVLYAALIMVAIVQFLIPVLAQGEPDLEKHLWLFNYSFDACFLITLAGAMNLAADAAFNWYSFFVRSKHSEAIPDARERAFQSDRGLLNDASSYAPDSHAPREE